MLDTYSKTIDSFFVFSCTASEAKMLMAKYVSNSQAVFEKESAATSEIRSRHPLHL